jgi:hypothetical protein
VCSHTTRRPLCPTPNRDRQRCLRRRPKARDRSQCRFQPMRPSRTQHSHPSRREFRDSTHCLVHHWQRQRPRCSRHGYRHPRLPIHRDRAGQPLSHRRTLPRCPERGGPNVGRLAKMPLPCALPLSHPQRKARATAKRVAADLPLGLPCCADVCRRDIRITAVARPRRAVVPYGRAGEAPSGLACFGGAPRWRSRAQEA